MTQTLARYSKTGLPLLVLAGALAGAAPACGGGDSDDGATLDDTSGSGGSDNGSSNNSSGGTGIIDVTTGRGGSSANTGGEGGSGAGECGGQVVDAEPVEVNLLLVIDRSRSMEDTPDGFDDDKWTTMVNSLKTALDGVAGRMSVGMQLFPDAGVDNDDQCGVPNGGEINVPIASGQDAVSAVTEALDDGANAPAGNTPAADALALALEYFSEGEGAELEGENYVLLAIDGGPNCNGSLTCDAQSCTPNIDGICPVPNDGSCCSEEEDPALNVSCLDDERSVAQVTALASAGITTFVVGIPGSDQEPYEIVLDAMAEAGGAPVSSSSPKFYQVQDAEELADTLVGLTSDLVRSCELVLERPPPDPDEVNVFVDDEVVPQLGDDGWEFDDPEVPTAILIKGETCTRIESEGAQSVRVEYGCITIEIPK